MEYKTSFDDNNRGDQRECHCAAIFQTLPCSKVFSVDLKIHSVFTRHSSDPKLQRDKSLSIISFGVVLVAAVAVVMVVVMMVVLYVLIVIVQ